MITKLVVVFLSYKQNVLDFYERNKFKFLYADEETERTEQHIPNDAETIYTRHMFLDLLHTEVLIRPIV